MSTNKRKRTAAPNEVYAYYIERLDKYGACQIISTDKGSICCVTLDYLESEPPTVNDLDELQPFYRESYRYHHHMVKSFIEKKPVPTDYIYIGKCELKTDDNCSWYSGAWSRGNDYIAEEKWQALDEEVRAAYKKYMNSGEFVSVHGKMIKKNISTLMDDLYHILTEADSLDAFPCIRCAEVTGYSGKLGKWLSETQLLDELHLKKPNVKTLDFSETHLENMELDMTGITKLILPETLAFLKMYGEVSPALQIDDSRCTGKINIGLSLKKAKVQRYGMERIKICRLNLYDIAELDMGHVAEYYPEIESIWLCGAPGNLVNIRALGQMQNLKKIYCNDVFGYTVSDLEVLQYLPKLCELDFDSVPKEAGVYLKKYWKGKLDLVSVTHLREENWLKENLYNPLRHWDGSEFVPKAAYKRILKCYKDTKRQLQAADTRDQIEAIVRQYTLCFNELNVKYDEFIETEEREDIFLTMQQLYEECILHGACEEADEMKAMITLNEIWNIMDSVREDW